MTDRLIKLRGYVEGSDRETTDIEETVLAVVLEGGSTSEVIEALSALKVTHEHAISTVHRMVDAGTLKINPNYTLSLTETGESRIGAIEPEALTRALGETTVRRKQLMNQLGKAITERARQ